MFRKRNTKRRRQHLDFSRNKWATQHKRSRFLKLKQLLAGKFLVFLGAIALLSGTVYTVLFTQLFIIQSVEITSQYKDINVDKVKQHVLGHVEGKNTLLVRMNEVEDDTYNSFPDVSSVSCSRHFFQRSLECEAIGYELVAVIKHQGKKYYINENGVVIAFDNRKLGLPIFDLILNPVYAGLEATEKTSIAESLVDPYATAPTNPIEAVPVEEPSSADSLTSSVLAARSSGSNADAEATPPNPEGPAEPVVEEVVEDPETESLREDKRLFFIQPFEAPPIEPLVINEPRKVFDVAVGLKILNPEELKKILEAIGELEKVLGRKVIQAQYVQVAGELSLTSKPELATAELVNPEAEELALNEDPDHQFTVLLDLRRSVEDQFTKLKKSKEVIDFSQVERVDLSIDGEKVFYR